ncbi:MAG: phosphoserine transaminase [Acidimicrobiia bacterium]|nr:MAG: phosphoserine transaminase [Acidimicrobiia bacterium]
MTGYSAVTIPVEMLPGDGRFGSGPSRINTEFVADLADIGSTYLGTSHRRPGVQDVVGRIRSGLSSMYSLPDGWEIVLGVGGATAFWDAAVFCLIGERSAHFVCGEFSEKFASVAASAPHLKDPVVIRADYGSAPEPRDIPEADVSSFIHNETSTGVLAPFRRTGNALVVVDGTSAAGAIPVETDQVDAYYFSPQKALGSEGGLWVSLLSPAAVERIESLSASGRWIPPSLSLHTALENSRKNQTYNTPSLSTLYLLDRQIAATNDTGGVAGALERSSRSSDHLYSWAERSEFARPFVNEVRFRSPTVVTIDIDDSLSADEIASTLRANGILDTEGYRKLGRNQLRVATFPNIPTGDVIALTRCIDFVVERLDAAGK